MDRRAIKSNIKHQTSNIHLARGVCGENYEPQDGRDVYRFFELFDLPNIPNIDKTLRAVAEEKIKITPPIKPYLEEKMWFALFGCNRCANSGGASWARNIS